MAHQVLQPIVGTVLQLHLQFLLDLLFTSVASQLLITACRDHRNCFLCNSLKVVAGALTTRVRHDFYFVLGNKAKKWLIAELLS